MREEYSAIVTLWKDVSVGETILASERMLPVTEIHPVTSASGRASRYLRVAWDEDPDHYREYLRFDTDLATVVVSG